MPREGVVVGEEGQEAPETVILDPTVKGVLLMVPNEPVRKFVPTLVVATSLPLASVERSAELMPVQVVPRVVRVEELLAKDWRPVQELALARLRLREVEPPEKCFRCRSILILPNTRQ